MTSEIRSIVVTTGNVVLPPIVMTPFVPKQTTAHCFLSGIIQYGVNSFSAKLYSVILSRPLATKYRVSQVPIVSGHSAKYDQRGSSFLV